MATLPPEAAANGLENWWLARSPGRGSWLEPVKLQRKDGTTVALLLGAQRQLNRRHDLARVTGFLCALPEGLGAPPTDGTLAPALAADALAALAEAVLVADAQGQVSFINATASRLLRIAPEQAARPARPRGLSPRQPPSPAARATIRATAPSRPRARWAFAARTALDPGAGEAPVPVVWTARVCFGPAGRAQAVVIVFRDPDEMSLTPEELVKANRFESLGQLAGGIAHDFNNLLTTILGGISLAKDSRDYSAPRATPRRPAWPPRA